MRSRALAPVSAGWRSVSSTPKKGYRRPKKGYHEKERSLCAIKSALSPHVTGLLRSIQRKEGSMGLLELLLIVLVIAAVAGGIGLSPLLWLLLVVALVVFLAGGGFGYRRGGRI